LGQDIKTQNPLEVMIDPTRPKKINETPVILELRRLWDAGFKVSPTLLGDKKGYDILISKENTELWEKTGRIINDKLNNLLVSEEYKKLDDEQKSKIIDDFINKSKITSRVEMVLKLTEGLKEKELKNKLIELKKSGLMTKEVFDLWQKIK
jgi:hypothetical protein